MGEECGGRLLVRPEVTMLAGGLEVMAEEAVLKDTSINGVAGSAP